MPNHLLFILGTVICEVFGSACIQASQQFTRPLPSVGVVVGYGAALQTMPLGVAYATWSGMGIFLVTIVGFAVFGQRPDVPALFGIGMILCGLITIHLFSHVGASS